MANKSTKYNPDRGPQKKRKYGANSTSLAGKHPGRSGLMGQPSNSMGFVHNGALSQKPSGPA